MTPRRVDGGSDHRFLYAAALCFGVATVCLVLILLSGCSLKSQQIAHGGLQAADLISTSYAESRGGVEANPVMRVSVPTRIALKSAVTVGVILASHQMQKMGHPRIAKGFVVTLNAVLAGVVINNVIVGRQ